MHWIIKFLQSSIGKKLIMSLTGLFLILFLLVHLLGNLQLLKGDEGLAFNHYAHFMGHVLIIEIIAIGLYVFILLHTIQGIVLAISNRAARGSQYKSKSPNNTTWASKNMALLGSLIFVFIVLHMADFWWAMKFGDNLGMVALEDGTQVKNLYLKVEATYSNLVFVILYVIGMIVLAFHLLHGFSSAFQTLGITHKKYTPFIKFLGQAYSILVPLAFALIPILMYIKHLQN